MPKRAGAVLLMVGLLLEGCAFALRQELSDRVLTSRAALRAYACLLETAAPGNLAGGCHDPKPTVRATLVHRD